MGCSCSISRVFSSWFPADLDLLPRQYLAGKLRSVKSHGNEKKRLIGGNSQRKSNIDEKESYTKLLFRSQIGKRSFLKVAIAAVTLKWIVTRLVTMRLFGDQK